MLSGLAKELGCKIVREVVHDNSSSGGSSEEANGNGIKWKAQLVVPLVFPKRKILKGK